MRDVCARLRRRVDGSTKSQQPLRGKIFRRSYANFVAESICYAYRSRLAKSVGHFFPEMILLLFSCFWRLRHRASDLRLRTHSINLRRRSALTARERGSLHNRVSQCAGKPAATMCSQCTDDENFGTKMLKKVKVFLKNLYVNHT